MEQLRIEESTIAYKKCAFTGHRNLGDDFPTDKLRQAIVEVVKRGITTFYCGMACGFDMLAAECVLECKKIYPQVKLVACIPCADQDLYYSQADKKRYAELCKKSDEIVTLSEHYTRGCMYKRDRYLADCVDMMIAFCVKEKGGTAYTVKYFKKSKKNGEIIFI